MIIQITGLSGSGKSTISKGAKEQLTRLGYRVEIIDGDEYRTHLCKDLGFSKADRIENIRRLGFVGHLLAQNGIIAILAAINPYECARLEINSFEQIVRTVWVLCDLEELIRRDRKSLYSRALLPDGHPDKINNLSGVNDPYEPPSCPDLILDTGNETAIASIDKLTTFILSEIRRLDKRP